MYSKVDWQNLFLTEISGYSELAQQYRANNPILTAWLSASSAQLAMLSTQVEMAIAESFEMTRDATVMAAASLRGLLPKASPLRVKLRVVNRNAVPFTVAANRIIFDANNRPYRIDTGAVIPAYDALVILNDNYGFVEAVQVDVEIINHVICDAQPFYSIPIAPDIDDNYLSALSVSDGNGDYVFRERFINTLPDERVFTVETDMQGNFYIRFGWKDTVGFQPANGDNITIAVTRTRGNIKPKANLPFFFETTQTAFDGLVDMTLDSILIDGINPPTVAFLRDLCRYPAIYNNSAVFLGDFEFLVRRNYPTLQFLSVWNEIIEENTRGANLSNINTLFVACVGALATETVLTESDPLTPVAPAVIANNTLTAPQTAIKTTLLAADNSYRVVFYTPVIAVIAMTINATIAQSYSVTSVRDAIRSIMLAEYGDDAMMGQKQFLSKEVHKILKQKIPALSDSNADLAIEITALPNPNRPELWRYVTTGSMTITVVHGSVSANSWG